MNYLHCPSCKRAYNLALSSACPSCPVPASVVDPAEDILAAAEQLARAMARATPDERDDAMARMDRLALPAPGARPVTFHGATLRTIRQALDPAPASAPAPAATTRLSRQLPGRRELLALAGRVAERLAPHVEKLARLEQRLLGERLAPVERLVPRARRLTNGLRDRVRALAA
jgi:hypothetical protein